MSRFLGARVPHKVAQVVEQDAGEAEEEEEVVHND